MSKLAIQTSKSITEILTKRDFHLNRYKESHIIFVNPKEKQIVVVPLHKNILPKDIFLYILDQAGLSSEEIDELVNKK